MFKSTTLLYASLAMFIMSLLSCAGILFLSASVNFGLSFIAYAIAGLCLLAMGFIAND
tara:strand:- start:694 stop:867 length:174 start_codon:yes stop_codon:yes gene_type:complete